MEKVKEVINYLLKKHEVILTLILISMVFIFTLVNPNFLKPYNLLSMSQSLVPYGILTLGILFVIATGNTDLSLGSVCIASAAIAGKLYMNGHDLWIVIPVMIIVSLIFGVINGYLIAYRKIPSFIATLGTMMFSRGISAIIVNDPNIFFPSGTWYNRIFSSYNGFPIGLIWLLGFVIITSVVIRKTKVGRYILAIGSNSEATRLSGIDTKLYLSLAYVISGLSAGIAAIFWSSSFATIAVATGNGMEFDAMAAAFIGGTSARGGSVLVGGSILGMIMLTMIRSGLNFLLSKFDIAINSSYITYAVTGIIIIVSILIDINSKKQNKPQKPKKKLIIGIIAALLGVSAFGYYLSNSSKEKTIAIIAKSESSPFWISVKSGCKQAGEDYGYKVSFRGPEAESASYLPQALTLAKSQLADGPVAVGMAEICEGYTDILFECYKSKIPVIEFDSGIHEADIEAVNKQNSNPVIGKVNTDNYAASGLGAKHAFEYVYDDIVNSEDEYLVTVIQHEQSTNAELRATGFIDEFMKLAQADPKTAGKCDYYIEVKPDSLNNNYKLALESLAQRGADIIFLPTTLVVDQVYDAILASANQYDGIKFVGFDSDSKQIEWLKNDNVPKLIGSIVQDSFTMGYKTVENLIKAYNNKSFETNYSIDGIWYDRTNVDELLKQGMLY